MALVLSYGGHMTNKKIILLASIIGGTSTVSSFLLGSFLGKRKVEKTLFNVGDLEVLSHSRKNKEFYLRFNTDECVEEIEKHKYAVFKVRVFVDPSDKKETTDA